MKSVCGECRRDLESIRHIYTKTIKTLDGRGKTEELAICCKCYEESFKRAHQQDIAELEADAWHNS